MRRTGLRCGLVLICVRAETRMHIPEQLQCAFLIQVRSLSLRRQCPNTALAAIKQAGLHEIKPRPGDLVLVLGLPALIGAFDLLGGHIRVFSDPWIDLRRFRLTAERP